MSKSAANVEGDLRGTLRRIEEQLAKKMREGSELEADLLRVERDLDRKRGKLAELVAKREELDTAAKGMSSLLGKLPEIVASPSWERAIGGNVKESSASRLTANSGTTTTRTQQLGGTSSGGNSNNHANKRARRGEDKGERSPDSVTETEGGALSFFPPQQARRRGDSSAAATAPLSTSSSSTPALNEETDPEQQEGGTEDLLLELSYEEEEREDEDNIEGDVNGKAPKDVHTRWAFSRMTTKDKDDMFEEMFASPVLRGAGREPADGTNSGVLEAGSSLRAVEEAFNRNRAKRLAPWIRQRPRRIKTHVSFCRMCKVTLNVGDAYYYVSPLCSSHRLCAGCVRYANARFGGAGGATDKLSGGARAPLTMCPCEIYLTPCVSFSEKRKMERSGVREEEEKLKTTFVPVSSGTQQGVTPHMVAPIAM